MAGHGASPGGVGEGGDPRCERRGERPAGIAEQRRVCAAARTKVRRPFVLMVKFSFVG